MSPKVTRSFIIGTFVTLYVLVSSISTIHVIDFFKLSNPDWLAISLALAFEVGAAASLASLVTLEKMNKWIVWALFVILTLMQAMGNTYYTYVHLHDYQGWIELFGLNEEDPLYQKRVLAMISGSILPIVALGFIKSLIDYIKPTPAEVSKDAQNDETIVQAQISQPVVETDKTREQPDETYASKSKSPANSQQADQLIEFGKNPVEPKVDNIKPAISSDEALARGRRV
jgi:hypothetical protein